MRRGGEGDGRWFFICGSKRPIIMMNRDTIAKGNAILKVVL